MDARTIISALALAITGAVFGVAGTVSHAYTLGPVPVGILVAAVACAGLLATIRLVSDTRWYAFIAGMGMLGAVLAFSGEGPGGSMIVTVPAEGELPLGSIWNITAGAIVLVAVSWPHLRARPQPATQPAHPGPGAPSAT